MEIRIESADIEDVCKIRHAVLWPDKPLDFVMLEDDHAGIHFGAFFGDQLVSVISLFPDAGKNTIRFRKFATLPAFQGRGIGSRLLEFVIDCSMKQQFSTIWCDARASAMPFYEKFGFRKSSESFFKAEKAYFEIEKQLTN